MKVINYVKHNRLINNNIAFVGKLHITTATDGQYIFKRPADNFEVYVSTVQTANGLGLMMVSK